eukprot:4666523-Amphidinium_carterae.1
MRQRFAFVKGGWRSVQCLSHKRGMPPVNLPLSSSYCSAPDKTKKPLLSHFSLYVPVLPRWSM